MTEPKRPLKVFLCHSSQDKPIVRELYNRLLSEGWIDPWLDKEKLQLGEDFDLEIEKAIESTDAVIAFISDNAVKKTGYIQKELRLVYDAQMYRPDGELFTIPLRLEDCEPPHRFKYWHWGDYFGEEKEKTYQSLLNSLRYIHERVQKNEFMEQARLKAEDEERQRISKGKVGYEASDKLAHEKAEKEAVEKARLEAEELARQKAAKEKAEREAAELAERERKAKELREKQTREDRAKEKRASEKKEEEPVSIKPKIRSQIAYWFGGFIILILGIVFFSSLNSPPPTEQPTPENTKAQAITTLAQDTVEPSATATPKSTSTPVSTFTPTPLPTEIIDTKGVSMALVPVGEFIMGSETNEDERPIHRVFLDAFYMDKYEVTNASYKSCVDAGKCSPPKRSDSSTRNSYYGNSQFDHYPVIYLNWDMAKTYCEWRDASLPTEAQWEKAARGADGRVYPWGEGIDCSKANYYDGNKYCVGDTTEVGSYESGKSPYGIYDMAGNVWEWVADWYDAYSGNAISNSDFGTRLRIFRGGSWTYSGDSARVSNRGGDIPTSLYNNIGIRCAKDAP